MADRAASLVRETGSPLFYFVNYPVGEEKFLQFYLPGEIIPHPITLDMMQTLPDRAIVVIASGCATGEAHPVTDFVRRSGRTFELIEYSGWRPCGMGIVATGPRKGGS